MSIRATRTPETKGGRHMGPESVRYQVPSPWPGIYGVFDARCTCTWAYGPGGRYQVKYTDAMCRGEHRALPPDHPRPMPPLPLDSRRRLDGCRPRRRTAHQRRASHRHRNGGDQAVKLAYADPPYLGCARRYREHPEAARWDDPAEHAQLMARLERDYDGWALSAGMNSLQALLPLAPAGVRVAAWVKPFSAAFPTVRIAYAWEPVIYRPARPRTADGGIPVKDFLVENMAMRRGVIGAKPEVFCRWVADLLGYTDGDTLDDLFPGTGVMGAVLLQGTLAVTL